MKLSLLSVDGIITSGLNSKNALSSPVRLIEPYTAHRSFSVSAEESTKSLGQVLHQKFPFRAVVDWNSRIEDGLMLINDKTATAQTKLRENDRITHISPETIEPSVPDTAVCLQQHADWSVWFKPAPMPVHAGGRYAKNTLAAIIEEKTGKSPFIVHRLDAVTSGLLLVAHNPETADRLSCAFREERVTKKYAAIVSGNPPEKFWVCSQPIRRKKGFVFETHANGMKAETRFEKLESDGNRTLLLCLPRSGRTHQIRLHARDSGFPIWDDPVYGLHVPDPTDSTLQNTAISLLHFAFECEEIAYSLFSD